MKCKLECPVKLDDKFKFKLDDKFKCCSDCSQQKGCLIACTLNPKICINAVHKIKIEENVVDMKKVAEKLMNQMKARREEPKGSLLEVVLMIDAYKTGNYDLVHLSKLYNKNYGGEYCEYLEMINVEMSNNHD